jgi:hypothetical protein
MKHKWHKEIKAWADGSEIQESILVEKKHGQFDWCEWKVTTNPTWETVEHRYRIKPQPKEPQYLYVWEPYDEENEIVIDTRKPKGILDDGVYKLIGKVKLEEV